MKKLFFLSFFLFALSISAQTVDVNKVSTIKVTGTAEIQVVPDTATFSLTVSRKDKLVAEAKKQNDETVGKITSLAKSFGVASTDVKTDYIRVAEASKRVLIPKSDGEYEEFFDGYQVNRSLVIKLRDMTKFESFLTALIDAGVTDVSNVDFSSSELRKHKDRARADAVRAAKEKASAIAAEIGQSIGRAVSIEENNIDGYRSPYANVSSNAFSADGIDVAGGNVIGAITVKAQVEVEFLLN